MRMYVHLGTMTSQQDLFKSEPQAKGSFAKSYAFSLLAKNLHSCTPKKPQLFLLLGNIFQIKKIFRTKGCL